MTSFEAAYPVRDCARASIAAIGACGTDMEKLKAALRGPMERLMARPDLLSLGIPRVGNNVAFSQYLYFDGQLSILIYRIPADRAVEPHDHGIWESLFVYRGRVKHTVYRRVDDGKISGFADLAVVNDGVLERGDSAIVAPPADIHGFVALTDDTYGITIVDGAYKSDRHYYQPEAKTYQVRAQRNAR